MAERKPRTGKAAKYIAAAERADWVQVVLNGGPPCFELDGGKFCLRAERWAGHDGGGFHAFVSLAELLVRVSVRPVPARKGKRRG